MARRLKQRLYRFGMHGAEYQRGGGAITQQLLDEKRRHLAGVFQIVIALLRREGVLVQPVQQLFAIGSYHFTLRIVNMGVDKPWHDHFTAVVAYPDAVGDLVVPLFPVAKPLHPPITNDQ